MSTLEQQGNIGCQEGRSTCKPELLSACPESSCVTGAGTEGITAHYNNVALASLPANTSLFDTAHFFALFNVAQFDGRIAYFTMKYDNLFWRPITAANQLTRYTQRCKMVGFDSGPGLHCRDYC